MDELKRKISRSKIFCEDKDEYFLSKITVKKKYGKEKIVLTNEPYLQIEESRYYNLIEYLSREIYVFETGKSEIDSDTHPPLMFKELSEEDKKDPSLPIVIRDWNALAGRAMSGKGGFGMRKQSCIGIVEESLCKTLSKFMDASKAKEHVKSLIEKKGFKMDLQKAREKKSFYRKAYMYKRLEDSFFKLANIKKRSERIRYIAFLLIELEIEKLKQKDGKEKRTEQNVADSIRQAIYDYEKDL